MLLGKLFTHLSLLFYFLRILISACIVALKYNESVAFSFQHFSKLCNISKDELIMLEFNFLELIHYKIYVSDKTYYKRLKSLAAMISKINDNYNNNISNNIDNNTTNNDDNTTNNINMNI